MLKNGQRRHQHDAGNILREGAGWPIAVLIRRRAATSIRRYDEQLRAEGRRGQLTRLFATPKTRLTGNGFAALPRYHDMACRGERADGRIDIAGSHQDVV